MQISIKKIGYKFGTSGWLAAGLADGSIRIAEGTSKSGKKHGLWMHYIDQQQQLLAIFNRYDLALTEYHAADKYESANTEDFDPRFTAAVVRALIELADEWCNAANAERDADAHINLRAVRAEVVHA